LAHWDYYKLDGVEQINMLQVRGVQIPENALYRYTYTADAIKTTLSMRQRLRSRRHQPIGFFLHHAVALAGQPFQLRPVEHRNARVRHPAMRAGTASITTVEGSGAVPAGTYRPTAAIGQGRRSPVGGRCREGAFGLAIAAHELPSLDNAFTLDLAHGKAYVRKQLVDFILRLAVRGSIDESPVKMWRRQTYKVVHKSTQEAAAYEADPGRLDRKQM
jgi:hypothetical protein